MAKITEIKIYPIKSVQGIPLNQAEITKRGLMFDRRFVLTNPKGIFVTQRDTPELARVSTRFEDDAFICSTDSLEDLTIPVDGAGFEENVKTLVWTSLVDAVRGNSIADDWFSTLAGKTLRLSYMPEDSERPVNELYDQGDDIVSYADGYPMLITNESSLEMLEDRIGHKIGMGRFRTNFAVDGFDAFAEDDWKKISIGGNVFRVAKPCARCVMTSMDQQTGEKTGVEPLKTLNTFRQSKEVFPDRYESMGLGANDVLFGATLIPQKSAGTVKLGDQVEIIA